MSGSHGSFDGMTVDERRVAAGLVGQFDAAIDAADRDLAVDLLQQVAMDRRSATATVEVVLVDPARYGYPRRS